MFKIDKIFQERLKHSKILKKEPFVSIKSFQRIVTMIRKLMHEESKFLAMTDKKLGGGKEFEKNPYKPADLSKVRVLTSVVQRGC